MHKWVLLIAAFVCSLVAGCGSDEFGPFSSACVSESDCFGYVCVETPSGSECATDCAEGCASGYHCGGSDGARCIQGGACDSDDQCGAYACVPGVADALASCSSSCVQGCADGYTCGEGDACVLECEVTGCPTGEFCSSAGCAAATTEQLVGSYFAVLELTLDRQSPLMAQLSFADGSVELVWLVRDVHEDGETPMQNAREPASSVITAPLNDGDSPSAFRFTINGATVPAAANPLTYRDMTGDFEFEGEILSPSIVRGALDGQIVNPTVVPLTGSAWAAVCSSEPRAEPASREGLLANGDRTCE